MAAALAAGWGVGGDPPVPVDVRQVAQMAAAALSSGLGSRAVLRVEQGPELPALIVPRGRILRATLGILLALDQALLESTGRASVALRVHGDMTTVVIDAVLHHDGQVPDGVARGSKWLGDARRLVQGLRGSASIRRIGNNELRASLRLAVDNGLRVPTVAGGGVRPRALVVDDQAIVLKAFGALLEAEGWEAVTASSVSEALWALRDDPGFALVLSDLVMPGQGGDALFRQVRKQFPDLAQRFVLCTAGAVTEERAQFLDGELLPVLHKPVALADLRQLLADALR